MRTAKLLLGVIVSFFILSVSVCGIGVSPPQLRVANSPVGIKTDVAIIEVTNTETTPVYVLFKVCCLTAGRENKLRVICNNESREVGIQRADLIDGRCPFCNSTNLTFYELPPDIILESVSLESDENPLETLGNGKFRTSNKMEIQDVISVKIIVEIPDEKELYGKNWELRIALMALENLSNTPFMMIGPEVKFLIDTTEQEEIETEKENTGMIILFMIIGSVVIVSAVAIFFIRSKKEPIVEPNETTAVDKRRTV